MLELYLRLAGTRKLFVRRAEGLGTKQHVTNQVEAHAPQSIRTGGAGSPSHNAVRQSSREFSQMKTKVFRKSRSFAGFHLLTTSILFVVVTSSLDLSSVHALRKM